jgi:hypothetical protein
MTNLLPLDTWRAMSMPDIAKYATDGCRTDTEALSDRLLAQASIVERLDFIGVLSPLLHEHTQLGVGLIFAYTIYEMQCGLIYGKAPYSGYIVVVFAIGMLLGGHTKGDCALSPSPSIAKKVGARVKKAVFDLIFVNTKQDKEVGVYRMETLDNPVPRNVNVFPVLRLITKRLRVLYLKCFARQQLGPINIIPDGGSRRDFPLKPGGYLGFKTLKVRLLSNDVAAVRTYQRRGGKLAVHMRSLSIVPQKYIIPIGE